MSHYVVSDLHGEGDRFERLLEGVGFSPSDTLYILGDVIDRGPDGVALLQKIRRTPNMVMLMGNHEDVLLRYVSHRLDEALLRRWERNGNAATLAGLEALGSGERQALLDWVAALPTCLDLAVEGVKYHLVHSFPGDNAHDRMWVRPKRNTPNPFPDGRRVIIGHTPVVQFLCPEEETLAFCRNLEARGDHLRILKTPGFCCIDCGCGYHLPAKRLACLRLEDGAEFYF